MGQKVAQTQLFSVVSADSPQMIGMQAAPWPVPLALPFLSASLPHCSDGLGASLPNEQQLPGGRCHPHLLARTFLLP